MVFSLFHFTSFFTLLLFSLVKSIPLCHLHSNLHRPPSLLFLFLSGEETVAIKRVYWGLGVWRTTVTLYDPALDPRRTNE